MRLLLDTCTFLWAIGDDPALSERAGDRIRDPANEVFFSAASAWEIAIKHKLGRLSLPEAPGPFLTAQRRNHGIEPLPIDEDAAFHVYRLPDLHRDPFDRILVAQALVHGLTILTPDLSISQYPVLSEW